MYIDVQLANHIRCDILRIMKRYLLLSLLVVGCGDGREKPVVMSCHDSCFGEVKSELEINCKRLAHNSEIAITAVLPLETKKTFCSAIKNQIRILDEEDWPCSGAPEKKCYGYYNVQTGIWVNRRGAAVVHEFFHLWEYANGINSREHPDWEGKGYYQASGVYGSQYIDIDDLSPMNY